MQYRAEDYKPGEPVPESEKFRPIPYADEKPVEPKDDAPVEPAGIAAEVVEGGQ